MSSTVQTVAHGRRPAFLALPASRLNRPAGQTATYGAAAAAAQQFMQWYATGGYGCGNWTQMSQAMKATSVTGWYNPINTSPMPAQFAADVVAAIDAQCPAPATVTPTPPSPGSGLGGGAAPTAGGSSALVVGAMVVAGIAGAVWWFKGRGSGKGKSKDDAENSTAAS